MDKNGYLQLSDKLARVISVISHPLLVPFYGMAVIFFAPTIYFYIPFHVKKLLLLIVLINNVLLPLSLMPIFIRSGMISRWTLDERRDRMIPLFIGTTLLIITTYMVFRFPVPQFLKSFMISLSLAYLAGTLINLKWDISMHSAGAGLFVALILVLSFKTFTPLLWQLSAAFIAGGLVMTSRLQLKIHNPLQVWTGFFTGFVILYLTMLLF